MPSNAPRQDPAVVQDWLEGGRRKSWGSINRLALSQAHKPSLELQPIRIAGEVPPHCSRSFLIHQGLKEKAELPRGELLRDAILHLNCMLSRPVGRASCRTLVATKPVVTQATGP